MQMVFIPLLLATLYPVARSESEMCEYIEETSGTCLACKEEYDDGVVMYGVCSISCAGTDLAYCLKCVEGAAACEVCDTGFAVALDGTCVAAACLDPATKTICSGPSRGECEGRGEPYCGYYDPVTGPGCTCRCVGRNRDPKNYCRCKEGTTEVSGQCEEPQCTLLQEHCSKCTAKDGAVVCSACNEGYLMPKYNCQQPLWMGCLDAYTSGEYAICQECDFDNGYMESDYGRCERQFSPEGMLLECIYDDSMACVSCAPGYTDPSQDCAATCQTPSSCTACSPDDPTVCTECRYGIVGYCMPFCNDGGDWDSDGCKVSGTICTDKNTCVAKTCVTYDPVYWDYNPYGVNFQMPVECSGHGTCEGGECKCEEQSHRDATTKCAACEPGYQFEGDACVPIPAACPANCASCEGEACTACKPGFSNLAAGCADPCFYSACETCDASNAKVCTKCKNGNDVRSGMCPPACEEECRSMDVPDGSAGDRMVCTYLSDGSAACLPDTCSNNIPSTLYYQRVACGLRGTCANGTCQCLEGHNPTTSCATCDTGYRLTEELTCVPRSSNCNPVCFGVEACLYVKDAYQCVHSGCLTGEPPQDDDTPVDASHLICAGRGECSGGQCRCSDSLLDASSKCVFCIEGYEDLGGTGECRRKNCREGSAMIPHCTKCNLETPTNCALCSTSYHLSYPSMQECVPCPEGMSSSAEHPYVCKCPDGTQVATDGKCYAPACLDAIEDCTTCAAGGQLCGLCGKNKIPREEGTSCGCRDEDSPLSDGWCGQPVCLQGATLVPHCEECYGRDPRLCASCAPPFQQNSDMSKCVCPRETLESGDECLPYSCTVGPYAVPNCKECQKGPEENTLACSSCQQGYLLNTSASPTSNSACVSVESCAGIYTSDGANCLIRDCSDAAVYGNDCAACLEAECATCKTPGQSPNPDNNGRCVVCTAIQTNCASCLSETECSACTADHLLDARGISANVGCIPTSECTGIYASDGGRCAPRGCAAHGPDCAACTSSSCVGCTAGYLDLRTDSTTAGRCVESCNEPLELPGEISEEEALGDSAVPTLTCSWRGCRDVDGCLSCEGSDDRACADCGPGRVPSPDGRSCADCIASDCLTCLYSSLDVCASCDGDKILDRRSGKGSGGCMARAECAGEYIVGTATDGQDECVKRPCPEDTYGNSCASCTETTCTECSGSGVSVGERCLDARDCSAAQVSAGCAACDGAACVACGQLLLDTTVHPTSCVPADLCTGHRAQSDERCVFNCVAEGYGEGCAECTAEECTVCGPQSVKDLTSDAPSPGSCVQRGNCASDLTRLDKDGESCVDRACRAVQGCAQCDSEVEDRCVACEDDLSLSGAHTCSQEGMSAGAIAGIIAAVVAIILVIAVVAACLCRKKNRRMQAAL